MNISLKLLLSAASVVAALSGASASAQVPLVAPDEIVLVKLHAEGAQIYECKPDSDKSASGGQALTWKFIEPIATLFVDGKSVGRHYAGPNWDHIDGGGVKGKVIASAPGATSKDIPWLKLEVVDHRGKGTLSDATAVLRVDTKGGLAPESCVRAGEYLSVAYAADYVFLRKGE
jgi:Protein of unknown function (DUF3455)